MEQKTNLGELKNAINEIIDYDIGFEPLSYIENVLELITNDHHVKWTRGYLKENAHIQIEIGNKLLECQNGGPLHQKSIAWYSRIFKQNDNIIDPLQILHLDCPESKNEIFIATIVKTFLKQLAESPSRQNKVTVAHRIFEFLSNKFQVVHAWSKSKPKWEKFLVTVQSKLKEMNAAGKDHWKAANDYYLVLFGVENE